MKKTKESVPMAKKFCKECQTDTLQNPIPKATPTAQQEYRCVQCGHPKRYTAKNWLLREKGKLVALPKP